MLLAGGICDEKSFPGLVQLQVREGYPQLQDISKTEKYTQVLWETNTGWEEM